MALRRAMWAVLATMLLGSYVSAQNTGVVQGVVKSEAGEPLAGAFVKLKNAEKRLTFMVITQDQGRYTAKNLPPGKYLAQGIGGERESDWTSAADVSAAAPATVNLTLSKRRAAALPNAWPGRKPGEGGGEEIGRAHV